MLENQSAENLWEPVCSGVVLRALLRWIYTKSFEAGVQEDLELLEGLYQSATQFQLAYLAKECYRMIFRSLNPENAFRLLLLADFLDLKILKDVALNGIVGVGMEVDGNSVAQWEHSRTPQQKNRLRDEISARAMLLLQPLYG